MPPPATPSHRATTGGHGRQAAAPSRPARLRAVSLALGALTLVTACTGGSADPSADPSAGPTDGGSSTTTSEEDTSLTLGVYGNDEELDAYRHIVRAYSALHPEADVTLETSPDHDVAVARWGPGSDPTDVPDLFLVAREDLPGLLAQRRTTPIDDLLGERRIDFGDDYYRLGLLAFSVDSRLQCMPATLAPQVVYYNEDLVSLRGLAAVGDGPVNHVDGWTLPQFDLAVRRASQSGAPGLYVPPTFDGLLSFLYSTDTSFLDDSQQPTSLNLSDPGVDDELTPVLRLLRNAQLNLSEQQAGRRDPVRRFVQGRLGMLLADRSLTPLLREHRGLRFDVMPLPGVDDGRTLVDATGYCLSSDSGSPEAAADLLAYLVGPRGAAPLAGTGYAVPSEVDVVHSPAFAPPGERPASSLVFDRAVNAGALPPNSPQWQAMEEAVAEPVHGLFTSPVIDLPRALRQIDLRADAILAPSPSLSSSPSG